MKKCENCDKQQVVIDLLRDELCRVAELVGADDCEIINDLLDAIDKPEPQTGETSNE